METKIKICGLFRPGGYEAVNEAEPDFVGFVFYPKKAGGMFHLKSG